MIDAPLALALGGGMVAAFNPCGFAMLPAYLAYFLGLSSDEPDASGSVLSALAIAGVLTAGFVLVFGGMGLLISWSTLSIQEYLPWVTMAIGVVLVGLGIAFLTGRQLTIGLPKLERGGQRRTLGSMFVFGVSYAVASLSCTIGPFLWTTGLSFGDRSVLARLASFVAYGVGMGLVIGVLTLALALAKRGVLTQVRRLLPVIGRISGGLLVAVGLFMTYLGYYDYRLLVRGEDIGGPASTMFELSGDLTNRVQSFGPTRLALVLAGLVAAALVLAWGWRGGRARVLATDAEGPASSELEAVEQPRV